jgi:CubicO group peptidase (beta-lactamase class C family)
MRRRGLLVWTLAVALLASAVVGDAGPVAAKDPAPKAGDPKLEKEIDEAVARAGDGKFWGTVLAARGGKLLYAKGFGFADYKERPNAADTFFELASASKQVTATAILRLEEKKRLKTGDSIAKIWKDVPKDKQKVTIDHLLHHTSGLSPELGVPYAWTGTREQYVKDMLAKPLAEEPGKKFAYSNVGYALLAAVVEEVTGGTFEEYVRKELFAPAGLKDTGFIRDKELVQSDRITVRKCDDMKPDWTAANWFWGWGYRGMGGVVTTALDVMKWDRALRGDKILGAAAKEKLYTPALEKYACGWLVDRGERGGTKVHHSGSVRGYGCQIARWLEDDIIVVVLSNGAVSPHAVEQAVAQVVFASR